MTAASGFPHNPPVLPAAFDYRDAGQMAAMYRWAGSGNRLAEYLRAAGVEVSDSVIHAWRRRHKIPVANRAYASRGGMFNHGDPAVELVAPADTRPASDEVVLAVLEWLKTRPAPPARPPEVKTNAAGLATELVGCDLHWPHHDRGALEVFIGAIAKVQPAGVTLNGDTWDFSQIGRYLQDPRAFVPLQQDIDAGRELLARISAAAPDAACTLVSGNHELGRWENYLMAHCAPLMSLRVLQLEALLGLAELGWRYEPDGYWLIDEVLVIDHGSRHTNQLGGGSAASARKEMLDIGTSGVSGHTHKLGQFYRQDGRGYRVWTEGGCLCDQDRMRQARVTATKRGPKREDWHLGFLRIDYRPGGDSFIITPIPILKNSRKTFAIVDGVEISATNA